jgi:hypothetical protein
MREPFRVEPALPVEATKTYSVQAPLASHWRDATCEEVDCPNWKHGWKTTVDESTDLGQRQAHYIRRQSGRRYVEWRDQPWLGGTAFTFEPGQRCFATHQQPLERDPLFLVRQGDWRGYGPTRVHVRPGDWVEDFSESLDKVRDRQERG